MLLKNVQHIAGAPLGRLTRDQSGYHGAPVGLHPRDPIAAANITHRRYAHSLQRAVHGPHVEGARPGIRAQFGFAATDRREAPGLTREEFGARAGIHRTYLSDIERGPRNVRSYEALDPEEDDRSFIESCAVGPVPSLQ
jgi:hypothetical protein